MQTIFLVSSAVVLLWACQPSPPKEMETMEKTLHLEKSNDASEPQGTHISTEWKIWALSSAAPSYIAANCTVIDSDMTTILRQGTNGWTAMAANPRGMSDIENGWKTPHEAMPMVGDGQSLKWVKTFMSGTKPELDFDGFAWMLHGDMDEDNSTPIVMSKAEDKDPNQWIESGPYLMLMPKDPATLAGYTTDFNEGPPYLMFSETQYAHLMIPIEDYYKYQQ